MSETAVSPIERWWPHLDTQFKHEILANMDASLSVAALEAVARLCGETTGVRPGELSTAEKDYIRTQTELVD